jgi:GAF domain-containing protein
MEEGRERGTIPEASTGDGETMVALARVIAQRTALAEFYAVALLQPSLETLLVEAARVAAKGCDAPQAKVLERDAQSAQFRLLAAWNLKEGYVGRLVGSIAADNPPGQCLAERRAVVVPDLRAHPDYHLPEIFGAHGVVASANVPIIGSRGAFGVLEIDVPAPRAFDALDLSYLAAVAGLVG